MLAAAALTAVAGDVLVVVGAVVVLLALVVARLARLVARHERAERRERVLGAAAAAFVSAWTREDVYRIAVDSALALTEAEGASVELVIERAQVAFAGSPPTDADVVTEVAVGTEGSLVIRTRERLGRRAGDGIETLAAQVALALEGAETAEALHDRQSAQRFRSLVQNSSDVILLLSPDLTVRYHTPSAERVLGFGEDELVGRRLIELLDHADAERLVGFFAGVCSAPGTPVPRDLPLRRKDGTVVRLESVFNNLLDDPNVAGVVVTARDVTERRELEDELAHQAYHDSLTGLANRALFTERVIHAIERGLRRQALFAVLFLDLDDFKTVNDSLGHAAGDELLVAVARRLRSCIRPEDTCARLGGDEFAVMIEDIASPDAAVIVAQRILGVIARPLTVLGSEMSVQGSVGIALGSGEQSVDEIMRSADLAMYRAKGEGKGRYAVYERSMHERVLERLALKADLLRAALDEDFILHYQPIVAIHTGEIVAVEALLRWRHPERGLVLPAEFLEPAEESGLLLPLGRRVLDEACRQAASWRSRGHGSIGVSVNISARQLASRSLPSEVVSALAASTLEPAALTLEITESTLLDSEAVIGRLEELRRIGVRIAIDDFGTGYSSVDHLRRFPVDTLKIARGFVEELGTSAEQERLVAAILRFAATLGLESVAEGVETEGQRDRLLALRCRYAQGFLYSRPLPADELDAALGRARVA